VVGAPRYVVRPYVYSRPYYVFRPRFTLGFGLWVGYPVTYPAYAYPYPAYPYPAYPPYPAQYPSYPASAPYPAQAYPPQPTPAPGSVSATAVGGVSFEITPNTASVYVDGQYYGTVNDFGSTSQPLSMTPGRHHVELQAPGYAGTAFDVDIVAGQVIPYQGDLQPN
jgi:hypothetical protein